MVLQGVARWLLGGCNGVARCFFGVSRRLLGGSYGVARCC